MGVGKIYLRHYGLYEFDIEILRTIYGHNAITECVLIQQWFGRFRGVKRWIAGPPCSGKPNELERDELLVILEEEDRLIVAQGSTCTV